jgi:hypothetical protein
LVLSKPAARAEFGQEKQKQIFYLEDYDKNFFPSSDDLMMQAINNDLNATLTETRNCSGQALPLHASIMRFENLVQGS